MEVGTASPLPSPRRTADFVNVDIAQKLKTHLLAASTSDYRLLCLMGALRTNLRIQFDSMIFQSTSSMQFLRFV